MLIENDFIFRKNFNEEISKENDIRYIEDQFVIYNSLNKYIDLQPIFLKDKRLFCYNINKRLVHIEDNNKIQTICLNIEYKNTEKVKDEIIKLINNIVNSVCEIYIDIEYADFNKPVILAPYLLYTINNIIYFKYICIKSPCYC